MRTSSILGAGLCLLVGGFAGAGLQSARAAPEEPPTIRPMVEPVQAAGSDYSRYRKLDRFARALAIIEQYYVRPVDGEALIDAALSGLVAELDPHTNYLAPADAKLLLEDTEGRFGGVGLVVTLRIEPLSGPVPDAAQPQPQSQPQPEPAAPAETPSDAAADASDEPVRLVMYIDDVIPGGPAQQAGLVVGDRILAIEGKPIANFSDLGDAVRIMRGEPGTKVSFTAVHADQPARELVVTRAIVDPPAVEVRWLGEGLGVLRLRDFQAASGKEMRDGLNELRASAKQAGGELQGVVMDLRDNGGGLLDQAINIADMFIADGVLVRTRGRQGRLLDEARAQGPGTVRDLPLVVLMNKGSASASEIVAGALQDHRRALIIGERSYGKGSVQAPFELGGGALIKLTTALYYTPDDRLIQASGIEPDVLVGPLRAEYVDSRPTLQPERGNPQHLEPQDFGRPPVPADDAQPSPARVEAGEDAQLLAAIDHLQAWARVSPGRRTRNR
ncbi:Carboxyl-terminal protease [Enhygromyxa salina]|uniref:Carboxyl-terminal protease n=1 Tax=Enhygromyxa salina TaxID=215803 RepID=A0A0C2D2V6_9BACT|nr:S41 family peptidase [Enhygromyxa salina]KIG16095.1 Carboxyl-terminal protease [Enhygromyxa salina]